MSLEQNRRCTTNEPRDGWCIKEHEESADRTKCIPRAIDGTTHQTYASVPVSYDSIYAIQVPSLKSWNPAEFELEVEVYSRQDRYCDQTAYIHLGTVSKVAGSHMILDPGSIQLG